MVQGNSSCFRLDPANSWRLRVAGIQVWVAQALTSASPSCTAALRPPASSGASSLSSLLLTNCCSLRAFRRAGGRGTAQLRRRSWAAHTRLRASGLFSLLPTATSAFPLASSSVHTCLPLPPALPQLLHPKRQSPEAAVPPTPHGAAKGNPRARRLRCGPGKVGTAQALNKTPRPEKKKSALLTGGGAVREGGPMTQDVVNPEVRSW